MTESTRARASRAIILPALVASALFASPSAAIAVQPLPESPVTPDPSEVALVDDELIVVHKDGVEIDDIVDFAEIGADAATGLATETVEGSDISLVELGEGQDAAAAIAELEADPRVESVEQNAVLRAFDVQVNDPYASDSYSYYLSTERFRSAWDSSRVEGSVTVAVLDTGVTMKGAYRNADLACTVDYADAWDVTSGGKGSALKSSYIDYLGHGTAVASLVAAAADNAVGMAGVSYNAKVLPVRVMDEEGTTSVSELVKAYDYVMSKASALNVKVVNMSLGGTYSSAMRSLQAVIDSAYSKYGILTVAAAGNESSSVKEYPASLDHVVSVAALDRNGVVASWSERNDAVDVAAAGVNVHIPLEWERSTVRRGRSTVVERTYVKGGFAVASGTSFSAPIVSGAAALLYAADPLATPAAVEAAITSSASDRGVPGKDEYYGYGELDAAAALAALPTAAPPAAEPSPAKAEGQSVSITSLKAGRKAFTVSWSGMRGVSGYEVSWRQSGTSRWSARTVGARSAGTTIAGLKSGATYQVRVRHYAMSGRSRSWGGYSLERSVTVR